MEEEVYASDSGYGAGSFFYIGGCGIVLVVLDKVEEP